MKRIVFATLFLFSGVSGAFAQAGVPNVVIHSQPRPNVQDRDNSTNLTAAPVGTARDRVDRAQRQQRQNQNFSGTGRAVPATPAPTAPQQVRRPVTPAAPVAPAAPNPAAAARPPAATTSGPATTRPAPARLAPARPAPARPGATQLAPPDAIRSGQALPSLVGQSTGAARGTPASR